VGVGCSGGFMQWRNFAVGSGGVYGVMMTLFLQWRDFAVETFCSGGGVLQWRGFAVGKLYGVETTLFHA